MFTGKEANILRIYGYVLVAEFNHHNIRGHRNWFDEEYRRYIREL